MASCAYSAAEPEQRMGAAHQRLAASNCFVNVLRDAMASIR